MRKRTNRRIYPFLFTVLLSVLFIFSSCGIPTIANFDDDLSISSLSTDNEFTISLTNDQGFVFNDNSPSLLLMYTITDQAGSNIVPVSNFNSTYGQMSSGRPVNFANDYSSESSTLKVQGAILNRTSSTNSDQQYHYGLFPFVPEGYNDYRSISASSSYTYNLNKLLYSGSPLRISFSLEQVNTEDISAGYHIKMIINNSTEVILNRFNGDSFITLDSLNSEALEGSTEPSSQNAQDYGDYWYFRKTDSGSTGIQINLYVTVNIMGNFSNLYWADLEYIGSIELP